MKLLEIYFFQLKRNQRGLFYIYRAQEGFQNDSMQKLTWDHYLETTSIRKNYYLVGNAFFPSS